jgi:Zn-dependent peptidase ImmA (M78 family)
MSTLIDLFVSRTPGAPLSPYEAMRYWVNELRATVGHAGPLVLFDAYLEARKVLVQTIDTASEGDGFIQPVGRRYEDGFLLATKPGSSTRKRFTMAHELCHTFFYELVPEIKYRPHDVDEVEERLCNYGASELLIPADSLKQRIDSHNPSLGILRDISRDYGVSMEAMLLRLRTLKLWRCDLSIWHHKSDGSYALDRVLGWDKQSWRWGNPEKVSQTWDRAGQKIITGWAYIYYLDEAQQVHIGKRVHVQSLRRGDSIFVLWSHRELKEVKAVLPLFDGSRKQPSSAKRQSYGERRKNSA